MVQAVRRLSDPVRAQQRWPPS